MLPKGWGGSQHLTCLLQCCISGFPMQLFVLEGAHIRAERQGMGRGGLHGGLGIALSAYTCKLCVCACANAKQVPN